MEWFWLFQCFALALAWTCKGLGWKILFHVLAIPIHVVLLPVYVAVAVIKAAKGLASLTSPHSEGRQKLRDAWASVQAERILHPKNEEDRRYAQEFCDKAISDPTLLIKASTGIDIGK